MVTMKKREIPTVKIGGKRVKHPTKAKAKVKDKPKAKRSAKRPARRVQAAPVYTPPVGMAPPEMKDTRPKRAPKQTEESKVAKEEHPVSTPTPQPTPTASAATPTVGAPPSDTRLVQGATCTWIGTLDQAPDSDDDPPVPVCPHCSGHLLTVAGGEPAMRLGFEAYELGAYTAVNPPPKRHPGYVKFMEWVLEQSKVQCWPGADKAAIAYLDATGAQVDPAR
jgi:hypothetical protein